MPVLLVTCRKISLLLICISVTVAAITVATTFQDSACSQVGWHMAWAMRRSCQTSLNMSLVKVHESGAPGKRSEGCAPAGLPPSIA
jgi:hypothetical protein